MESRKIQRSGTTFYLYLPASWCREHKITTDSIVHLSKSSSGDLLVSPKKIDSALPALNIDLPDNSAEVINKMIIASYINPVKEFNIKLKEPISPDQVLTHKKVLGGLELVDFDESSINCHTSQSLSDPNLLLDSLIKRIISIIRLLKKDSSHELIQRYEEEVDKTNLLMHKSIIASLMYRRESKLRHIDLFYIGSLSRLLEQLADVVLMIDDAKLIGLTERMLGQLIELHVKLTYPGVIRFIKQIEDLEDIKVNNLESYKEKRLYSLLGHIAETLCDWVVTEDVDKTTYSKESK